jgi:L-fuculose-phosphate aldolase
MNRLRYTSISTERDLRVAIVETGRICYNQGWMVSNDGNISARLGDNYIVITPAGVSKGRMDTEDPIVLDLDGNLAWSKPGSKYKPSTETPMHLEVYRQRDDVRGVIHAHPVYATALTVAGQTIPIDVFPELILTLGDIPVTDFATPSSHEDAEAIKPLAKTHDAILLRQHGSLTVGKDLDEALINLERVEHVSQVTFMAKMFGEVGRLPPEMMDKLIKARLHGGEI